MEDWFCRVVNREPKVKLLKEEFFDTLIETSKAICLVLCFGQNNRYAHLENRG
jgi:hypothetical protein